MKKFLSAICATALAGVMSVSSFAPAVAMPATPAPAYVNQSDVTQVQLSEREWRRMRQENRAERRIERRLDRAERRIDRREERRDRREAFERRDRGGYYRGYRGYRYARPGYRYHDGFYYPSAAFIAGAIITGAIANSQPRVVVRRGGNGHVDWCYNRYRSYRASDNTYQPSSGPRRECVSPY